VTLHFLKAERWKVGTVKKGGKGREINRQKGERERGR